MMSASVELHAKTLGVIAADGSLPDWKSAWKMFYSELTY